MSIDIMNQISPGSNVYVDKYGYVTYNPGLASDPNQSIGIILAFDVSQDIDMMKATSLDGSYIDIPGMLSGVSVNQTIELYPSLNTEPPKHISNEEYIAKSENKAHNDMIDLVDMIDIIDSNCKKNKSISKEDVIAMSTKASPSSFDNSSFGSIFGGKAGMMDSINDNKVKNKEEPIPEEVSEFHFLDIKE